MRALVRAVDGRCARLMLLCDAGTCESTVDALMLMLQDFGLRACVATPEMQQVLNDAESKRQELQREQRAEERRRHEAPRVATLSADQRIAADAYLHVVHGSLEPSHIPTGLRAFTVKAQTPCENGPPIDWAQESGHAAATVQRVSLLLQCIFKFLLCHFGLPVDFAATVWIVGDFRVLIPSISLCRLFFLNWMGGSRQESALSVKCSKPTIGFARP